MKSTQTSVITAGWYGQDEAISVPLIPSFLHPSFTLGEVALGTHLYGFRHAFHVFIAPRMAKNTEI